MERKRRANLAHKREIEAQIEEKRRRKQLEDELQELDNQKVESEAREQAVHQLQSNEAKKQQPQFKNIERMFNNNTNDDRASVLQGESNRHDKDSKDSQTARSQVTDNRTSEIYKAMQLAELAAAEEKHRRLLKKLQKGGHDTRQLERKFAEYKSRITGVPLPPEYAAPNQQEQQNSNRNLSLLHHHEFDRDAAERERNNNANFDAEEEKKRQATLDRIFQMIRENTKNALPAELSEEDIKQLIINKYVIKAMNSRALILFILFFIFNNF